MLENEVVSPRLVCQGDDPWSRTCLLRQKVDRIEEFLRQRCLVEGQVVSVLDTRFPSTTQQNQWQEDADWITGLYVGAESLRYATTGETRWDQRARDLLKDGDLLHPIQISLAYILGERDRLPNRRGNYLPIEWRPPKEFGWNYYAGEEARRATGYAGHHGIHIQYSGVDYLLAYWLARYHSLVC